MIGSRPVTEPMFTTAWNAIQPVMPAASSRPKISGARTAMRMPVYTSATKSPMTMISPISPAPRRGSRR